MKTTAKTKSEADDDKHVKELGDIKRLLMLALMRDGVSQGDLAKALGVSQPTVSRMFPGNIGLPAKRTKGP